MSDTNSKTRWHRLLGKLLECLLTTVDIQVQVEPELMSQPPKGDIILLRRQHPDWTAAQKALLADGIRDTTAAYILLEFKYTESVNRDVLQQTLGYEYFYRQAQQLNAEELACFLLSAKTPQAATLERYGYELTDKSGVYCSKQPILSHITLISLNDLADTPHNAWLRMFASKQKEKEKAARHIRRIDLEPYSLELYWFLEGFLKLIFRLLTGDNFMKIEVTPEDVIEIGQMLEGTPLERSMIRAKMRELMTPEERLEGLTPEERLKGLEPEAIEAYLEKIKHNE